MNFKKHIPNAITCGNLFCGCLAIVSAFNGNLVVSAYLVGLAAVLDFFDGFAARLLKVSGEMGKQLDSLADMVTFGVVPGVIMYMMLLNSSTISKVGFMFMEQNTWIPFLGFSLTIFSCIRLAKFNIDVRQTSSFIGVPTPANTIFICSLPLISGASTLNINGNGSLQNLTSASEFIFNPYFLLALTIIMSYLLVAELPLFALKFKTFGWEHNKTRYSFLIISLILLILFQFIAIPFIIFLYIVLSVINNLMNKTKTIEH
ncbi:MAG: CDP-alcohol phosphatidyltransferase family protein [Bacteroidetes bacterium]|nr:CDP-alcohol phosphatidyltransferase family protein [Bacteroidota bacterium]